MRDEYISTAPRLTCAEDAILYVLKRLKVDADLRWHMLGTEAFERLCDAEAKRSGHPGEYVRALYATPATSCADDKPKLVRLRAAVSKAIAMCDQQDVIEVLERAL